MAVFGGSWAQSVVEQCQKMGFDGDIWPVHPDRDEVHGLRCYRSVSQLPAAPDASFIGVNRHLTIDVVGELSARGAGGAVCFASGFNESDGRDDDGVLLQTRLLDAADDMPIIGPNCYGLINYLDGALLWPDQHGGERLDADGRGVALLLQSSNIAINLTMQRRHLPIAYVVCLGNQAQTDGAAIASALLDDDRVSAIGMYLEGIADVGAFERFAWAAHACGKPVVVLKAGKSDAARSAALTHTASMAGSDAASRAFFKQQGVACVDSLSQLIESLKLLHFNGPMAGRDICSISCSGGEASIMADAAEPRRLHLRPLDDAQKRRVGATLSELVTISNPLDYHTFIWGDEAAMTATFSAMFSCGFDLSMMVLDFPRTDRCDDDAWNCAIDAVVSARERTATSVAVVATLAENISEAQARTFIEHAITPLQGVDDAMVAAEVAADIGDYLRRPAPMRWSDVDPGRSEPVAHVEGAVTEADAKALLSRAGIAVPAGVVVTDLESVTESVATLQYPLVAKVLGIMHKTEHDAVRLNLHDARSTRDAVGALLLKGPGVLLEQQVEGTVCELLVGVYRDEVYGAMLTLAAGGVLVELLDDSVMLRMPVTPAQVSDALTQLRIWPILNGYRGSAGANVDAIVDCAMQLQRIATWRFHDGAESLRVGSIDINPLVVSATDATAVDALITLEAERR